MKNIIKFPKKFDRVLQTLLMAALALSMTGNCHHIRCFMPLLRKRPSSCSCRSPKDVKVDAAAKTFRLVGVNPQVLYFTDRPVRMAGHIKMTDYLEGMDGKGRQGQFRRPDPPNATLSVYEPGKPDNTLAAVEISQPVFDGADLIYSYKLIEGELPAAGGATSLFIDWIGVGGGVGPGFHGVGVGFRGPGLR